MSTSREDAAQPGDGRDAQRPGQDGGVAGAAAGLGDDAGDLELLEQQRLRRQDLRGDEDDRLVAGEAVRCAVVQGELGHDAADDVADVGHALLEVLVLDLGEEGGVFVEHLVQGGAGVDVALQDARLDLADQGGVAEEQAVAAEDGRLVLADCAADALDDGVELLRRRLTGRVEAGDLGGQPRCVEILRLPPGEHGVHAVGASDGDPRGDGDSFEHALTLAVIGNRSKGKVAPGACLPIWQTKKPKYEKRRVKYEKGKDSSYFALRSSYFEFARKIESLTRASISTCPIAFADVNYQHLTTGGFSMLNIFGPTYRTCDGLSRRSFLKAGFLGLGGLTLADHLRLKAQAAQAGGADARYRRHPPLAGRRAEPYRHVRPQARTPRPSFAASFSEIATNVTGIRIGEHLPLQARLMDKMAIVRSVTHTNAGHGMGSHWMLTGYVPTIEINDNLNPCCGSVVARMRGANGRACRRMSACRARRAVANAAYLGAAYNPFSPGSDPEQPRLRGARPAARCRTST